MFKWLWNRIKTAFKIVVTLLIVALILSVIAAAFIGLDWVIDLQREFDQYKKDHGAIVVPLPPWHDGTATEHFIT